MEDEQGAKSTVVIRLLAALLTKGSNVSEGAPTLAALGVSFSDIAAVFGSSEGTVRSIVSKARRAANAAKQAAQ